MLYLLILNIVLVQYATISKALFLLGVSGELPHPQRIHVILKTKSLLCQGGVWSEQGVDTPRGEPPPEELHRQSAIQHVQGWFIDGG